MADDPETSAAPDDDIELSPADLDALITTVTRAFRNSADANQLLRRIGYPADHMPSFAVDPRYAWTEVFHALSEGIIPTPYRRLLTEALRPFPANPLLARLAREHDVTSTTNPPSTRRVAALPVRHVMVVGASPDGAERVRGDRELKHIQQAADRHGALKVSPVPAAAAADLSAIGDLKPDVLHLACHADGANLVFETAAGAVEAVAARRVVDLLLTYRQRAGVQLHAVVLNACLSAGFAPLFTPVADVVISHRGDLDDDCAAEFAGRLYLTLRNTPSIAAAADMAAAAASLTSPYCADLRQGLVILPPPN